MHIQINKHLNRKREEIWWITNPSYWGRIIEERASDGPLNLVQPVSAYRRSWSSSRSRSRYHDSCVCCRRFNIFSHTGVIRWTSNRILLHSLLFSAGNETITWLVRGAERCSRFRRAIQYRGWCFGKGTSLLRTLSSRMDDLPHEQPPAWMVSCDFEHFSYSPHAKSATM